MPSTHTFYSRGQERVQLYLYTPYGLYRASVLPQEGTRSFPVVKSGRGVILSHSTYSAVVKKVIAITLHTLRLVKNLSACTRGYRVFPRGK